MTKKWKELNRSIVDCKACVRLRRHCEKIAVLKRRQYREETYWGRPVPGFGDPKARLWIIGLAPGAHGANRTGRVFTGDSSGDWLYRALFEFGFANQPESQHIDDGLKLIDAFVSSAGRCAPPDNKPTPTEIDRCHPFLRSEFRLLRKKQVFLALGKIAFVEATRLLREELKWSEPFQPFSHGGVQRVGDFTLMSSYHPSRQNTQTGRLTRSMWLSIFARAKLELA